MLNLDTSKTEYRNETVKHIKKKIKIKIKHNIVVRLNCKTRKAARAVI